MGRPARKLREREDKMSFHYWHILLLRCKCNGPLSVKLSTFFSRAISQALISLCVAHISSVFVLHIYHQSLCRANIDQSFAQTDIDQSVLHKL